MGLREKVTITLVIIALTQIACRHCMPRTPRKASLKRYLNDLKPVKTNPVSTPYFPSKVNKTPKQTFGKTAQNGRISQCSQPKESLYSTYNFPENEYPLDNAPRDPFRIGMNFNENNRVNTLQKARNLQSSAINDLKKEMKMKRKLLSNKQMNNENIPLKTDMSSIKIVSNPDSVRLLDPETFPEVQYPLNTMETWGQNYWNYLPFTQEKQINGLGQPAFNPKAREVINKPFARLTKAKASKFLKPYDKLKEEHRRTSTENSKRSNVGQKGLNFTKTATCERVSDDFITAGFLSNTLGNPSAMKTLDSNTTDIENSAENTCPIIENSYHSIPLPYKVIEENMENVCPAFELKNNTQELEDVDSSVIAKTLQLIEEILLNDDTSSKVPPKTKSKEKENNVNTTETGGVGGSANKDIPINPIDNAETSTVVPIEELLQEITDDVQADILPYDLLSLPEDTIPENTTIVAGPSNVRMPLPFTEPVTNGALANTSSLDLTNQTTLSKVNTVPGYTSIIIVPMNNDAVGKSHMFDTTSDTPIIVYLPSTQSSSIPSQTPPLNHIVYSSLGNLVPNNQLYNVLSNMAPVQNNNPSSTGLVSELLNSISDSGSSLPIHETLPTNSKCYNNENSPSSMREKPFSDIRIHKSLIDDAPFVTSSCDENLYQQTVDSDNFDMDPDTLPPIQDFEHPVFDFSDNDITSLSHGPYNNVLNNELPIIVREIDSDHQITDTSSKDLFIATQNITTGHLHKTSSMDSVSDDYLSESPNGVPSVPLDKDFSSETATDSLEILRNLTDSLSNLPVSTDKSSSPSPISKQIIESPQPMDEMPPTLIVHTPTVELSSPIKASLTPTPLSETFFDKLPEIMDTKVLPTIILDITSDSASEPIDNTPVPSPILNSSPMTTDLTVKAELYKIRQILDKMLSSEAPTVNQTPSIDTTLSPISKTGTLPLLVNQSLPPIQTAFDSQSPPLDKVLSPISTPTDSHPPLIQTPTDGQPPPLDKVLVPIQTPTDHQPPPLEKVLSAILDTDNSPLLESKSSLLEEQTLSPIQTPTDSQPPTLDKVLSSPIQIPTDRQPPPLDKVLSPIHTPTDHQPPPLEKVLSAILDTDNSPLLECKSSLLEEQTLSPIQTPTDSQPPPLDKVLSPIHTPTDHQPPPLEKVLSAILDTDNSPLLESKSSLLEEQTLSPSQTPTDSQPPPLDKVLSPIPTPTDNYPPPIQTPTDGQPPPIDKVLSPIQTPTDSHPPPIQTPTDGQPPPLDKVLVPIQTPTNGQPPPLDKVLVPIQTPTDSQSPTLHKVLSQIQRPTDSQPPPLDKVLSPILMPTNSHPPPLDKVLSPITTPTDSHPPPLDKVLSHIPTPTDIHPPPIQTPTDSRPPPLDKVLSPIQRPTDSQPPPLDKVLSPIHTPTDRQPPPLDKVLSPILDTDSLSLLGNKSSLLEEQTMSPIQTPTDGQPPPLDKVLVPIQTPTDSQLPTLHKVLSPIQRPTDSQPPPLEKVLSAILDTDNSPLLESKSSLLEEQTLSPIQTPTDSQPPPLDKVLSPIHTPTDHQPPPLEKVLSAILDTDNSPLLESKSSLLEEQTLSPIQTPTDSQPPPLDKVLSPIHTPTDHQPPPLEKVLSAILDTDNSPLLESKSSLLEEQTLSPIQTPTDSQPPTLDKVLSSPILMPTNSHPPPLDKVLSPITTPTDSHPPPLDKVLSPIPTPTDIHSPPIQTPTDGQLPTLHKVLSPIQRPTDSQPPPLDKVLSPIHTPTDRQPPPLEKVLSAILDTDNSPLLESKSSLLEEQTLSPIQTPTDSQPPPLDKVLSPIHTPTDHQPPPLEKVLSAILDTDNSPLLESKSSLLEEQTLSPIQTPTDSQPPTLDKVLSSPIQIPTDRQPPPLDKVLSPIHTPTDHQPPPLEKVLSPIQTPTDSHPPPIQTPTDGQPPPLEKVLVPIQTPTDGQPLPLDKVLVPIQTPTDSQSPTLHKVLSPIQRPTDSQPPQLDKVLSPIHTPTDRQPPPLDKVLSPILDTDSLSLLGNKSSLLEEQTLSPIQMPTDRQPPTLDKVLSPITTPTDSQPPQLDNVLSPKVLSPITTPTDSQPPQLDNVLSPIQTPTDSQPPPLDKVLSPIPTPTDSHPPPIQTPTDGQPPPLDKVLVPIQTPTDSQSPTLHKVLSPIQRPTDSQPPPLDKVLSPIHTPTDRQPPPLDKVLSPILDTDSLSLLGNKSSLLEEQTLSPIPTLTDSQSPTLDKVLLPIQMPSNSHSPPLDKVLSPIPTPTDSHPPPIQTPTDGQPPPLDKVLVPIQTPTDSQSPTLHKVLSPIQRPTDSQPPPLDKVLSPIQMPTNSHPPPLDKVLSPILDTDSLSLLRNKSSLLEEQTLSPIQTPTDSQPPTLDKVLPSSIQMPTDRQPPQLDKVLSPIQTPTDSQPPPLGKILSPIQMPSNSHSPPLGKVLSPIPTPTDSHPPPIQTPTDGHPPPLDKVLVPIQTPTDSQSPTLHKVLSPIQRPTDSEPPPLDKVLSPITTPTDSQPPQLDKVLSPIQTPTDSQPPPLDKVLSPIQMPSNSHPPPLDKVLSPIQMPTNRQPPQLDKVLSPIQTPTDSQPLLLDKVLSPIQMPSNSHPPPLDKVLSPIPTSTDRQPPTLDKVLLPIQTPTDSQPPQLDNVLSHTQTPSDSQSSTLDKALSQISDTDSLPLLENKSLSPTQKPTDSMPLLAGNKTLLPLPVTDSPIDSLQLQDHDTLLKPTIDDGAEDNLPSPMDKSHDLSNLVLETTESPPQTLDETVPPIPLFETAIDNKPYLIGNLVKPMYEPITSRTKDITNNRLLHKMDDFPLKMDLDLPDIYEVYNDDLPLSVDDLPIKVHQGDSDSTLAMVDLPMDVVETPNLLSKTPVSDLLEPTEVSPLPVEEVLEIASPGFLSDSDTSSMSDSMDHEHHDFPRSKVPFDGLPALPMDGFKSPIHEVIPNSQFHDISSKIQPQTDDSPLSVDKLIPDISLSDALSNEPFVIDDAPSPVIDRIIEIPNSTADTKDPPLIDNRLLKSEDDAGPDTLVTDIPTAVLPPLNEALQSTYIYKISDEVLSESTLSDLHHDDLPLPDDKTLPLPDNTLTNLLPSSKTLSTSKLPITKALLENVLSDITKGVLSSQVTKAQPVTPPSDKTFYCVDVKPPLSETKEIPLLPVENTFSIAEHNDNLIDNLHALQKTEDTPTDLSFEFPLPMDRMYNDKPEISTDADGENETESETSGNLTDDQPLPKDKISPLTNINSDITRKEKLSSSKLPIAKALLENVLSEINTKRFSIPVSKAVSATSSSMLDKTHYHTDSPYSDFAEDSPPLPKYKILPKIAYTDNNSPLSRQSEDTLLLEEDKALSKIQSIDISTEMSLPMDKIVPNNDLPSKVTEILPFPKDTPSDSQLPNNKNKISSSSKLPITKALLENVLSDITKGVLSSQVTKAQPVTPPSDKTFYCVDVKPPLSEIIEIPLLPVENTFSIAEHNDNLIDNLHVLQKPEDTPTDLSFEFPLPMDRMYNDKPEISTDADGENETESETSGNLTDDQPLPKDKISPLTNINSDITRKEKLSSSKLPIAKALLENVLSEINTKGFSIPVSKAVSATSSSMLDKTHYHTDSPYSDFAEDSPPLPKYKILPKIAYTDNNSPLSRQSEDTLLLEEDKALSKIQSIDISTEMSSPMDKIVPNNDLPSKVTEILPFPNDTPSDSQLPNNKNKISSSSKLPITKALLENVLSDITKGVLSSQVTKAQPVTPPSDKTFYCVDVKPPLSDTKEIPLLPVENTFSIAEHNDNLIDNLHVLQKTEDTPTDLSFEFPLPMDRMYNDKPEISTDADGENETESETSGNLTDDQPFPKDKICPLTNINSDITRKEKLSSSKLPITKALLENVLSEINTKGFSIPVSKAVSATSSSMLDKTHYHTDSPYSDFAEDSPPLPKYKILPKIAYTDNNSPLSRQSEDTLLLEEDKALSKIQSIDISTEMSSPMDKIVPNNDLPSKVTEILPFPKDTPSDSQLPNNKNKISSSSKLPIAKALLENVLSDINTKGFSLSVAKALPMAPQSQLDKTLYFFEAPRRDTSEENSVSDVQTENDYDSQINEDVLTLSADKVVPNHPILDIPTDKSISGKIYENNSDDLTEEVADSDKTLFSEELTDDFLSEMEKQHSLDGMPEHLSVPRTRQLLSSRLPITKALLEKVLSDITNGPH